MIATLTYILPDEAAMIVFAERLACVLPEAMVIFLHGQLGAGKTTFSRGLLRGLGYEGKVKSPTYTLVETYLVGERTIFHFDLYRLVDPNELEFIGFRDYVGQSAICLIEWPEQGGDWLPQPDLSCYIDFHETGRMVRLVACSERGEQIVKIIG